MHSRIRPAVTVLSVVALLAVCGTGAAALGAAGSSSSVAGTWSGKYNGAFSGTFTLHWKLTRSKLTGSIDLSKPHGTYGITGSVDGSAIKFGAVGAGATYTGSVSGKSMSGTYMTPRGGGRWSAHKTSNRTTA